MDTVRLFARSRDDKSNRNSEIILSHLTEIKERAINKYEIGFKKESRRPIKQNNVRPQAKVLHSCILEKMPVQFAPPY